MISIGKTVKWAAIILIAGMIGTGIKKGIDYHYDQIDAAVNLAKLDFAVEKRDALNKREEELRATAKADREAIERKLIAERARVSDLRRMLLIDHDLDRLLQQKPGLILPRVNEGTEAVLKELEELTQ